ncbi:rhodanese-like domain-containing protein [Celeribacter sp.]|uniref:rhodanese-like domain-containing protein n=1 Tax=Celeribacter sp. TaxID=1890673 RepID=UPI003A8DCA10
MFGLFNSGPKLSIDEVKAGMASGEIVLVDVRDAMELRGSGKAKGAINVPLMALQMKTNPSSPECLPEFKQGKRIVLYCASGARSSGAARMLRQFGHESVDNLGGLRDWANGGGEIVRV